MATGQINIYQWMVKQYLLRMPMNMLEMRKNVTKDEWPFDKELVIL